jgi:hypothetical protein
VSGGDEKGTKSVTEMEEVENATADEAGTQEMGTDVSATDHKVKISVSSQSKNRCQLPETAASGQQLGRVEQEEVWRLMRP